MDEAQWLSSNDPVAMLRFLTESAFGPAGLAREGEDVRQRRSLVPSDRKLRLFACACCRQVWDQLSDAQRVSVVFAEQEPWHQAALGGVHPEFLSQDAITTYTGGVGAGRSIDYAVRWLGAVNAREVADQSPAWLQRVMLFQTQAALLRDIAGNPFRRWLVAEWAMNPEAFGFTDVFAKRWITPQVLSLAHAAYDDWLDDGTLDPLTLCAMADALEEAGAGESDLIGHLRSSTPHVRGCWVLDLILGKE